MATGECSKKVPKWYIKTIEETKGDVFEQRTRSQKHQSLICSVEPQSFAEANDHFEWKEAMNIEMSAITKNRT